MEAIVMIAAGVKKAILTSVEAIVVIKVGWTVVDSAMQKEVEQAPSAKEEAAPVEAHPQEAQIRTQSKSAMKRHTMRMKTIRFFSMRLAARVTYLTSSWRAMEPMKTS